VGGEFTIFQWHADTFSLPEGAVCLATSSVAENQAFRIGRAVYGTQFHFEADTEVVRQWKGEFPGTIERIAPGWLENYDELAARHGAAADAAGLAIARAWVSLIERQEAGLLSQATA
jgi:GMP synthase (glutamine-hydrolysing)